MARGKRLRRRRRGAVFAGIYQRWRDGLLETEATDEKLAATFEEFFAREPTVRQIDKLLRDQY